MQIVDYESRFQPVFKRLNVDWIEMNWQLEDSDRQALDDPDEYIIDRGGHIFLALDGDEVVGTCALLRVTENTYELAKMAVDVRTQGKGVGAALGTAVINKARSLRADKLYLESNTILEPAIRLYRRLGFEELVGEPSPYERCNIQMLLKLSEQLFRYSPLRGDLLGVEPQPVHASDVARVLDFNAAIHDYLHASRLRHFHALGADYAKLKPQKCCADCHGFTGDFRYRCWSPENVDDADWIGNIR